MGRPRDRSSGMGLLPRMEPRPRKDGLVTYRYHPVGGKPINLGTDKNEAIRQVLSMNGKVEDGGTVNWLWSEYQLNADWKRLSPRSKEDYAAYSVHLLRVFGAAHASQIGPPEIHRYLRKERAEAPVRANREIALLSNLMNVAVELGLIAANPCSQIRRNKERARSVTPEPAEFAAFIAWCGTLSPQRQKIGMMAEFAALAGNRRAEFLELTWPQVDEAMGVMRIQRAKQQDGQVKFETIDITPPLVDLLARLRALPRASDCLYVFTTRDGNPYAEDGFTTMWHRTRQEALTQGVIHTKFTFHDLRAYYTTQHKKQYGDLPELHANSATTARVYDRSKSVNRKGLG